MLHPTDWECIRAVVYAIGAAIVTTLVGRIAVAIWPTLAS